MSRKQAYCQHCQIETLHELDPSPTNHVAHLLASVFLCGLWLPVWLLIAVMEPARKMRCLQCGQAIGELSPRERDELNRKRIAAKQQRTEYRAEAARAASRTAAEAATAAGRFASIVASFTAAQLRSMSALIGSTLKQVDQAIWTLSGHDAFMVWFCRCLLFLAMAVAGIGGLYALSRVVSI